MTADVGGACVAQRTFGDAPGSGTLTTPVIPAWAPSTAYVLDTTAGGINRVINGGNLYQCRTSGTSASSGGPTGTSTNITDGTAHWTYEGAAPSNNTTTGSQILGIVCRGTQSSVTTIPNNDNDSGGTYTTISNTAYNGFPDALVGIFRRSSAANNKTGFTASALWGPENTNQGDEVTVGWLELRGVTVGAPHTFAQVERASGTTLTGPSITTTVQCLVVSFWFGNGEVVTAGTSHDALPGGSLTLIPGLSALVGISGGYIQMAAAWRIANAGTFSETWTTTGEGAQIVTVAYAVSAGSSGSGAITLGDDTASAAGAISLVGAGSTTQAGDTAAGAGSITVVGGGAISLADDTAASTGQVAIVGAGGGTLADDTLSASGAVALTGAGAGTAVDDTVTGAGVIALTGSGSAQLADDTASGASNLTGGAAIVLGDDTATGGGVISLQGAGSPQVADDLASGVGDVGLHGDAAVALGDDVAVGAGTIQVQGTGAITLADDTASGAGSAPFQGASSMTLADDTAAGSGFGPLAGVGAIQLGADIAAGIGAGANDPAPASRLPSDIRILNTEIAVKLHTATFRQGSTHRPLTGEAFTENAPINFPSEFPGGVVFRMVQGATVIEGAAVADELGNVSYTWGLTDLAVAGSYEGVFVATDGAGRIEEFPTDSNLAITVVPTR